MRQAKHQPTGWVTLRAGLPTAAAALIGYAATCLAMLLLPSAGPDAALIRSYYIPVSILLAGVAAGLTVPLQVTVARNPNGCNLADVAAMLATAARYACLAHTVAAAGVITWLLTTVTKRPAHLLPFLVAMLLAQLLAVVAESYGAILRGSGRVPLSATIIGIRSATTVIVFASALYATAEIMMLPATIVAVAAVEVCITRHLVRQHAAKNPAAKNPAIEPEFSETVPVQYQQALWHIGAPVATSCLLVAATSAAQTHLIAGVGESAVVALGGYLTWHTAAVVTSVGLASGVSVSLLRGHPHGIVPPAKVLAPWGWLAGAMLAVTAIGYAASELAQHLGGGAWPGMPTPAGLSCVIWGGATAVSVFLVAVLEDLGKAPQALLANAVFLLLVVAATGWSVAHHGSFDQFCHTMAGVATLGAATMPLLAWWVLRRHAGSKC